MGRKTKINEKVIEKICTAIKLGCTVQLAAGYAGITVRTLYYWIQRGKEDQRGQFHDFFIRYKAAEAIGALTTWLVSTAPPKMGIGAPPLGYSKPVTDTPKIHNRSI